MFNHNESAATSTIPSPMDLRTMSFRHRHTHNNISLAFCPSSSTSILNNNINSYHRQSSTVKSTHPALTPATLRGQFAKRLRPSTVLHGDCHDVARTISTTTSSPKRHSYSPPSLPAAPHIKTVTTPTASLVSSLTSLASTGAGIFILGFIVFVHESGHFLAARLQGIRVKTFSIGFGPTIWSASPANSETEFTLRLLPLGGYVSFPEHYVSPTNDDSENENIKKEDQGKEADQGEEAELVMDNDPNLLQNRPVLDRAIVVSAGVVANVILAWVAIFSSVSIVGLPQYDIHPGALVASIVDPAGPAARDGILPSDVILSLNDELVPTSLDSASTVAEKIRTSRGQPLKLNVLRTFGGSSTNPEQITITVRPKCCLPDGSSSVGIQLVPNAIITRKNPTSPLQTISMTNSEFTRLFKQTWRGLKSLVLNFKSSSQNLSGPIGVVSIGADLARNDSAALFTFCAIISINLALINSLPLPALDGGQMTFLIIEAIRGAPVSLKIQDAVNRTALVLLLTFSGVLFFGDLERLNVVGALQKLFG